MPDITERILHGVKTLSSILCFEEAEDSLITPALSLLNLQVQPEGLCTSTSKLRQWTPKVNTCILHPLSLPESTPHRIEEEGKKEQLMNKNTNLGSTLCAKTKTSMFPHIHS